MQFSHLFSCARAPEAKRVKSSDPRSLRILPPHPFPQMHCGKPKRTSGNAFRERLERTPSVKVTLRYTSPVPPLSTSLPPPLPSSSSPLAGATHRRPLQVIWGEAGSVPGTERWPPSSSTGTPGGPPGAALTACGCGSSSGGRHSWPRWRRRPAARP